MYTNIIGDEEAITLNIPLNDLIWTMIVYSNDMWEYEKEALGDSYPYKRPGLSKKEVDSLIRQREYKACRRDELSRLISMYSDFDTSRIYDEVDKIFKQY